MAAPTVPGRVAVAAAAAASAGPSVQNRRAGVTLPPPLAPAGTGTDNGTGTVAERDTGVRPALRAGPVAVGASALGEAAGVCLPLAPPLPLPLPLLPLPLRGG